MNLETRDLACFMLIFKTKVEHYLLNITAEQKIWIRKCEEGEKKG